MKKIFIAILISGTLFSTSAQDLDLDNLLEGGVENANSLVGGYLEPAFAGFGYAMNAGWYNTARPHKLLGFDLTFGVNMAMVPSSAQYYKVPSAITVEDPLNPDSKLYGTRKVPTIFGPNLNADDIPFLVFNEGTEDEVKVTAPTGAGMEEAIGMAAVPAPFVQFGIGVIKNTDIKLRLVPEQDIDGNTIGQFGLGVMHDVKQWIPGIKNLPFDLSGFFAFNKLTTSMIIDDSDPNNIQTAEFEVGGTTLQGVISKKLAVLTVYSGLGFTTSKTSFKMKGTYDELPEGEQVNPISITSNNGGPKFNVGARLKLLILTFHAEYSFQQYNTFTAGIGLSIR